jgi:hypothetical protein
VIPNFRKSVKAVFFTGGGLFYWLNTAQLSSNKRKVDVLDKVGAA